jgi:hypothetical protein
MDSVHAGEVLYRIHEVAWSAWARRRHRADFDRVERFCLFVGYPRSGHSLLGALVNAHPDAVISHELNAAPLIVSGVARDEIYARILARAAWFNLRGNTSNYSYQVANQWQGRFRSLRVVGDKRGGAVTRCLAEHPDLLDRTRALVGVPLRLVHVVRNPFDNIAAISIWNELSLADSIDFYFDHCRTTARLGDLCRPGELLTLRHEEVVRSPAAYLEELCRFLGLETDVGYVDDCRRIVFGAPTYTRQKIAWSASLVCEVERRARAHRFLDGYEFDIPPVAPAEH